MGRGRLGGAPGVSRPCSATGAAGRRSRAPRASRGEVMRRHQVGTACQSTTPHNGAAPRRGPPRLRPRRRGTACVLAMTFLVLLSALSLGFYASTTMSSQIASNEDRLLTARLSAESGMEFMRYQLG